MWAAVICSASPSSRDKGAEFHAIALRTGSLSFVRLQVGSRSVLTTSVLWIALEISSCRCKGIPHKILWSFTFYAIASDRLFELCSLQDGPRSDLRCLLYKLAVEISCCAQYVFSSCTKSFFLHKVFVEISSCHPTIFPLVVKIRHSAWRNELWSLERESTKAFGFQILDSCNQSS